ncbi:hypothetical protein [Labrenzia sp. R5_0]|jgi:hypothetical protein|uniref:hypothetical protein n=1 Tax=Stappiaceae TaxID=2821832 RepID=UPI001AD97C19|nr:hypothetical protein [Labrenzia sp. R5_0]MBO9458094.1 hypothetical protein [Labrenzia sp. R5_0]
MKLTEFELDSIRIILEREEPTLLKYLPQLCVSSREDSGVGRVTRFARIQPSIDQEMNLTLGKSLYADIGEMAYGVGFMLFIDEGVPTELEVFSHSNEVIPKIIVSYKHSYI